MLFELTRPLPQCKAEAAAEVDKVAGETRLRFITTSPGQEATYTAKLNDAKAYIAAGYPTDTTPYIWIATEAAKTGSTPQIVADLIVYTSNLWSAVGAQIEGSRQMAKQSITGAINAVQVRVAVQLFITEMSLL
jgi:hypothetical protein